MFRRTMRLLLLFSAFFAGAAHAQGYPNKPIRMIVPYAPGGSLDALARMISEGLGNKWKQNVIVDNRAGAAGNIGTELAFRAPPDGYTLLATSDGPLVINKHLYRSLPFQPDAFIPISILSSAPMLITINPKIPIRTLPDFISYAKSNPGKLSFGSSGLGGSSHLAVALFEMMSGTKFNHVPYKGMAPATADFLAGHLDFIFGFEASLGQHFNSDRIAILAVTNDKRIASLPNVPAVAEVVPGYAAYSWFAILAPPGTPEDIVARLSEAINEILRTPEAQKRMHGMGQVVLAKSGAEAKAFVVAESEQWGKVVRATGATAE